jgi:hypothetical protein
MTMSRLSRSSLLAIAATAAIAMSALTPTNASAWGHFGGGFHGFHGGYRGFHFGFRGVGYRGFHFGFRRGPILSHFPYRFGHWGYGRYHWGFGGYRFGYGYRWWNPHVGCWRFGWCYPHPRPIIGGPIIGGPGVGALAATAAPMAAPVQQPVAQQPNCLVKQYLPNGAVEFADVCTQEQAIAMPNGAPNAQPGPQ